MIAALAKAARVLSNPRYACAAQEATNFIFARMSRADGRLMARYREGEADFPAYLDDYAFLLWAMVELYEATFSLEYLDKAIKLANELENLFMDNYQGGFFFSGIDGEEMIIRAKELYDGAMPSGNSVAAYALLKLARIVKKDEYFK